MYVYFIISFFFYVNFCSSEAVFDLLIFIFYEVNSHRVTSFTSFSGYVCILFVWYPLNRECMLSTNQIG